MTTATRPTYRIDYRDNDGHAQTINLKCFTYDQAKIAARMVARETREVVEITMVLPGEPSSVSDVVIWNSRDNI